MNRIALALLLAFSGPVQASRDVKTVEADVTPEVVHGTLLGCYTGNGYAYSQLIAYAHKNAVAEPVEKREYEIKAIIQSICGFSLMEARDQGITIHVVRPLVDELF